MVDLGGFAAVAFVPQAVIDATLDTLWSVIWQRFLPSGVTTIPVNGGTLRLDGGLEIERPTVALAESNSPQVSVAVVAHGRFSARLGTLKGELVVRAEFAGVVPLALSTAPNTNLQTLDFSAFRVTQAQMTIEWSSPSGLPSKLRQAVVGTEVKDWIADRIRASMRDSLWISIPFTPTWRNLTTTATGQNIRIPDLNLVGIRVLDGWIAVGLDAVGTSDGAGGSQGDLYQIQAPDDGHVVEIRIDSGVLLYWLQNNVAAALVVALAGHPNVHVALPVAITYGGANDLLLTLTGTVDAPDPFTGSYAMTGIVRVSAWLSKGRINFSATPKVTVDSPAWLDFLGLLGQVLGHDFPLALNATRIAQIFDDDTASGLSSWFEGRGMDRIDAINRSNYSASTFGWQRFELPSMPGTGMYVELIEFALGSSGVRVGVKTELQIDHSFPRPPADFGPLQLPSRVPIRRRWLALSLLSDRLALNPTYRVHVKVRRDSDGQQVLDQASWSGPAGKPPTIDLWKPEVYVEEALRVEFSVERPPGTAVATGTGTIVVEDKFDRAHPYVRWSYSHQWTDPNAPTGSGEIARRSVIHKTDIRARCQFCDSGQIGTRYNRGLVEALDSTRASPREGFRTTLCPYCFNEEEIARFGSG